MIITQVTKKEEDGSMSVQLMLTEEQTAFLINFALGALVQQGLATIQEAGQVTEDQAQVNFLENLNPKEIPQA